MNLPIFALTEDPGPSFFGLLERTSQWAFPPGGRVELSAKEMDVARLSFPHGTTIAAIRYDQGVVMAGDRRATEGNFIAHRRIEKVFPADAHSGVAIAGAAGPAVEMVRLFKVQLEHYEKVEGTVLSLEGKANQLSQMIRANLPMAMQGMVVVPLFAGWDLARDMGRIFNYDVTGGRYEEVDYHATGSGGRDARATIKLGFRENMSMDQAVRLAIRALFEAAEEDSATGGPDPVRGIYPVVAIINSEGYQRLEDADVATLAAESINAVLIQRGDSQ